MAAKKAKKTARKARKAAKPRAPRKTPVLAPTPEKQEAERRAFVQDVVDRCVLAGYVAPVGTSADGELQYILTPLGRAVASQALVHRGITREQLTKMTLPEFMAAMMRTSN